MPAKKQVYRQNGVKKEIKRELLEFNIPFIYIYIYIYIYKHKDKHIDVYIYIYIYYIYIYNIYIYIYIDAYILNEYIHISQTHT